MAGTAQIAGCLGWYRPDSQAVIDGTAQTAGQSWVVLPRQLGYYGWHRPDSRPVLAGTAQTAGLSLLVPLGQLGSHGWYCPIKWASMVLMKVEMVMVEAM